MLLDDLINKRNLEVSKYSLLAQDKRPHFTAAIRELVKRV